jgi:hypothetical protein
MAESGGAGEPVIKRMIPDSGTFSGHRIHNLAAAGMGEGVSVSPPNSCHQ